MMVGFGAIAFYRWHQTQLIFFLLLVLRDFAAGFFFLKRETSQTRCSLHIRILAYVSSAMPLLYFGPSITSKSQLLASDLLSILGFLIVALATLELGVSIGISPATRGLVRSGVYKYLKHPMYTGYVLSEIGLTLVNPFNVILLLASMMLYFYRAKKEERLLQSDEIQSLL